MIQTLILPISLHISFCLYISSLHICIQTFCFLALMLTTTKGKGPRQGVSMSQTIWVVRLNSNNRKPATKQSDVGQLAFVHKYQTELSKHISLS